MTSRKWLGVLASLLALTGLALAGRTLATQAASASMPVRGAATPQPPHREIPDGPAAPAISFIDNQTPTCYLPTPGTGACYILWNYLYVTAGSSQYIISMTVSIDGQLRAYHSGFFQTLMYIPGEMFAPGFKVTCGWPGASGVAGMGNTYNYTVRARETGGLSAANYGSITCPADVARVYLPFVKR
jgi:hypothetical protein